MTSTASKIATMAKINALLSKTTEAGASEAEAFAALAKARELMEKYQIDEMTLSASGIKPATRKITIEGIVARSPQASLIQVVANFCDCKTWVRSSQKQFFVLGLESDIDLLLSMCRALKGQMFQAVIAYMSRRGALKDKAKAIASFQQGFVMDINRRMKDEKASRAPVVPNSAGSALVVLKGQLVQEAFAALGLHLGTARKSNRTYNNDALSAGMSAGARASLGNGKAISSGPLRIGAGA